jgi:hypothetical protein
MKKQTIFRKPKNAANPYVRVDKAFLNDNRLSFRAKGIMAYLLSKPDNWELNTQELQNASKEGRDAVRAAVKELISLGYVRYEKKRVNGKFTHVYTVHEDPAEIVEAGTENLEPEKPEPVEPKPEQPKPESQGHNKVFNKQQMINKNNNTNKYNRSYNSQKQFKKFDELPEAVAKGMNKEYDPKDWEVDPEAEARLRAKLDRMRSRLDEAQKNGTIGRSLSRVGA